MTHLAISVDDLVNLIEDNHKNPLLLRDLLLAKGKQLNITEEGLDEMKDDIFKKTWETTVISGNYTFGGGYWLGYKRALTDLVIKNKTNGFDFYGVEDLNHNIDTTKDKHIS